jgi:predicted HicB family RNase H-like nuclease
MTPSKKIETVQSTMRLPKKLWQSATKCARERHFSLQQVVIFALEEYLEHQRKGEK